MDFATLSRTVGRDDPAGDADPYASLAWMRAHTPVAQLPGPPSAGVRWLVTSYELARACLTDPALSFDPQHAAVPQHAPGHRPYLLAKDGPEHARLRGLVGSAFSPGAVDRLRPAIERISAEVVAGLADRPDPDLVAHYALPIPELVTYELIGVPPEERLPLGRSTELSVLVSTVEQHTGGPAAAELHAYVDRLLTERLGAEGGLLAHLTGVVERGEASRADAAGMLYLLFSTSQLSTAPFLAAGALRLIQHRDLTGELPDSATGWRRAAEEALRHDAALQMSMPRFALRDLELGGERIAKGDAVYVSVAGANRDPARFAEPDAFRPDRRGQGHLGFGFGPHFCLGAPLARVEGEIALRALFHRLPEVRLTVPGEGLVWVLGPMLRCPRELPVATG